MPRAPKPAPSPAPDTRDQELVRLRARVAELERALAEPERVATALRESEAQFRSLVANVPGMVYRSEATAPWRDLFVSENVHQLCGFAAEELTRPNGTAFGDLILPEDWAIVESSIASAQSRGGTFDIRYRIRHADGRIRWVHDQGKVTASRDGTPLLLDGVIADITDRMQAELSLRENEARYATLVASVPGAVYLCETSSPWKDTFMSAGVHALTGYSPADLLRPDGITINDLILPEDLPAVIRHLEEAIFTGQPFELRYRIRHVDGGVRWVYDRGQASYAADGIPLFLGGVMLDITDRMRAEETLRESEARYRTLVSSVPGAVYLCEPIYPWTGTFMSAGVELLTGFPQAAFAGSGQNLFTQRILADDLDNVVAVTDRAIAGGEPWAVRYRIRHADGSVRWVFERGQAAYGADNRPLFLGGVILDITGRVMAEETLREAEERFRALVRNVPGIVYRSQAQHPWQHTFISDGALDLTGHPAAEFMQPGGTTFGSITVPEDQHLVTEAVEASIVSGGTFEVHYRILHADGGIRWMHDQGRATLDAEGRPLWLDGVIVDVTERIAVEEALRQGEERYRTLVANVPGAVYRCAIEYPYLNTFMSEGMRQLSGYGPEAFFGPDAITFDDLLLPEDRLRVESAVDESIRARLPFEIHYRIRHADGGLRWIQEQGQAVYAPEGEAHHLEGVMVDVTARTLAEEALRASEARLMEAQRIASTGSWELDLSTRTAIWSEETYRIYGRPPSAAAVTYDEILTLVHPEDRERLLADFWASVREHRPLELTHRLLLSGGALKHVQANAEHVYDTTGTPLRSLGTVRDITESVRAEETRLALEAQLRKSQKMEAIGTLAGGIAHDFNNILAAVIGHTELLAQDLDPQHQGQEGIRGILLACVRAKDLVQQILTFSRLRERERRLVAVEPIILEALKLLRPSLPATIEIRTEICSEGTQILADPTQLHQVMVNLCTNAAHAMRERGGVLDVQCRTLLLPEPLARAHPGRYLELTVRDTGHGMDADTLDRVFDPFFTTKPQGEGSGLGLAVVHGIVQSHDGIVTATSAPGEGTTFQIYFPAVEGRSTVSMPEEGSMRRGSGEHILVVDDEPSLVRIASRMLDRLGYRVTAHTRPAEALADFLERPGEFDLVLSDLTMPRMTGLDLASLLLERRPDLPILLTSGYSGSLDPEELARLGIRELVGKPFLARTIAEAVARALKRD